MTFASIYLAALLLPGAALCRVLGLTECRVVFSVALSLFLLVACLLVARLLHLDSTGYGVSLLVVCAALAIAAYLASGPPDIRPSEPGRQWAGIVVASSTIAFVALYQWWAGPYLEVPADGWYHIGQISDRIDELADGHIGVASSLEDAFGADARYWYTAAAYLVHVSGESFEAAMNQLALANSLLFSAAVYSFALFLFGGIVSSYLMRHAIAALSVLFYFTQFGIDVFSYLRYYTFAPAFLTYVMYLAAIACVCKLLTHESPDFRLIVLSVLFLAGTAMLHVQEAMFVLVMTGAIIMISYAREARLIGCHAEDRGTSPVLPNPGRRRALALAFWSIVVGYFALHLVAYETLERRDPLAFGRLQDIGNYLPFLRDLYILKPTYQFYQVVTVWGLLVYVLFFLNWRRFAGLPFLVAGMLVPFLTVFNPLFTDFFLRVSNPTVLWRICFVLPLPFMGAYFSARGIRRFLEAKGLSARIRTAFVPVLLLVLLLPIETKYFVAPHSKIYMLSPVIPANDHRHWQDLLEFLDGRETSGIITDRVTGYVINGMTRHVYRGWKFSGTFAPKVSLDSYADEEFQSTGGWKKLVQNRDFNPKRPWLVVLNQRSGALSTIGRLGRHWPEDVMDVSQNYSSEFMEYVRDNRNVFNKVWENEGIEVYEVITS